ncbi:hypothetical protein [Azospirillum sp. SYSU D00513]|uniref:hypothetical protein n=1 Tax=Azospirillum sp. SYSU D00513 TaxID=2812561 RepID=UPI001FFEEE9A|nr:hypothetical protein [Azospirillum sp. SYSU D00513]
MSNAASSTAERLCPGMLSVGIGCEDVHLFPQSSGIGLWHLKKCLRRGGFDDKLHNKMIAVSEHFVKAPSPLNSTRRPSKQNDRSVR